MGHLVHKGDRKREIGQNVKYLQNYFLDLLQIWYIFRPPKNTSLKMVVSQVAATVFGILSAEMSLKTGKLEKTDFSALRIPNTSQGSTGSNFLKDFLCQVLTFC